MLHYYCLPYDPQQGVYQCLQMGDNYSAVEFGTITIDYKYSCITSPDHQITIFGDQMVFDWPEHVQVLMMMTLSYSLLGNMSSETLSQLMTAMQEYGINI